MNSADPTCKRIQESEKEALSRENWVHKHRKATKLRLRFQNVGEMCEKKQRAAAMRTQIASSYQQQAYKLSKMINKCWLEVEAENILCGFLQFVHAFCGLLCLQPTTNLSDHVYCERTRRASLEIIEICAAVTYLFKSIIKKRPKRRCLFT